MTARRPALGRGLDAVFGSAAAGGGRGARTVPITDLAPGPFQPRRRFDEAELESLAESIRQRGIVQPILARPAPEGGAPLQIVAGERRWRAAQRVRLHEVPVIVDRLDDREAAEVALIENVQREDLGPLEEAEGYRRLMDEFGGTQESLAAAVGKSRSHVANTMRLLGLPEPVRRLLDDGTLSAGHGRALLGAADPEALARKAVSGGLNVRQVERRAREGAAGGGRGAKRRRRGAAETAPKSADLAKLEEELEQATGFAVSIVDRGESGQLRIDYRSLEQLDFLIARLRGPLAPPPDS